MIGSYCLPSDDLIDRLLPTITASDEDPAYPVTNWSVIEPAKPSKLTTPTGWWEFDFGVAVNAAIFAPIYHNFDPGLPVILKWNSSSSWTNPAGVADITVPEWTEDGWSVSPFEALVSTPTYRYYRLEVALGSPGNSYPLSLGRPFLGGAIRHTTSDVRWGVVEDNEQRVIDGRTEGDVDKVTEIWGPRRSFQGEFRLDDTDAARLLTLHRTARNRVKPWLLIPDVDVNEAWIVRFLENKSSRTRETLGSNGMSSGFPFRVQELSRGIVWP